MILQYKIAISASENCPITGLSQYPIPTVIPTYLKLISPRQFSYRKMLAVSSKGEEEVDFFQFPSGCQCFHQIAA